ncbi:hypothetical protein AVEN_151374-1 [Araneus ventricosus]|uniref:Uncharacterized protein n=1 Tax=Araneus ventricosus TaxID=182803 RepID=A0A4Y2CA48_ARAVE|nr:hypothetical protein AVEN_151374-1 [Araneus ventricosus]
MQDGSSLHIANPVKRLIGMCFGNDGIINRHFPSNWSPRSLDLNPCDFWLWGHLKHVVFSGPILNLVELKTSIEQTHSQHQHRYTPISSGTCYFWV